MIQTKPITIDIVFATREYDTRAPVAPPEEVFIEVENSKGASIKVGTWLRRPDGYNVLRIDLAAEYAKLLTVEEPPNE